MCSPATCGVLERGDEATGDPRSGCSKRKGGVGVEETLPPRGTCPARPGALPRDSLGGLARAYLTAPPAAHLPLPAVPPPPLPLPRSPSSSLSLLPKPTPPSLPQSSFRPRPTSTPVPTSLSPFQRLFSPTLSPPLRTHRHGRIPQLPSSSQSSSPSPQLLPKPSSSPTTIPQPSCLPRPSPTLASHSASLFAHLFSPTTTSPSPVSPHLHPVAKSSPFPPMSPLPLSAPQQM